LDRGAPLGAQAFAQHYAVCHGPNGRGNGPAAPSLFPRPRDFSSGRFKYKSTAAGDPPTDEDLLRTIRDGLPASMTWDQLSNLDEEDLRAIVAYVRLLPPVNRAVPLPRPPAAEDCETYTLLS